MDSTLGAAFSGLLGTLVALAFVLGLAWISLKFLRRWQDRLAGPRQGEPERQLRFVRALPIGQRERLILVEAEGELMLIGVSAGAVTLLRNWGSAAPVDDVVVPPANRPAANWPATDRPTIDRTAG